MARIEPLKGRSEPSQIKLLIGVLTLSFFVLPSVGYAQKPKDPTGPLESLRNCAEMIENDMRLACYDAAIAKLLVQQEAGEIRLVDKEDIAETRRSLFGFSLPKLGVFGSGDDTESNVLKSKIVSVRRLGSDKWLISITEGSVWQVSNAPRRFKPEVGDPIELEKAAMSSYWVRLDGALGVKGRRVQ